MRILYTADPELPVPPLHYGGIERIIASLIEEVRKRGHQVGLVANRESTQHVDFRNSWPGKSSQSRKDTLLNTLQLARSVAAFRPDVIHSFSRIAYLTPLLPLSVPKVMSYQREPSARTTSLGNRLSRGTLTFTGCSEHIAATGRRAGGDWKAISNFIDPGKLAFVPEVASDAPLVFLSRIEPIKGCHTAIAIAKASGRRLLIAGNRVETGSAAGYWDKEIAPHLGKDGIEYVGTVDDEQKNALLGQAAAMVVPIEWEEPFGIVFAEALACGTPVISCPRGALPEIVRDGVHGFLIQSIEEGADSVNKLRQINRNACREQVEKHFTVEIIASRYLEIYQGCE
ncbi:MAG: glycosyltransferase [Verrucomicrobiota bacterium]